MSSNKSGFKIYFCHVFNYFMSLKALYPQGLQEINVQNMLVFVVWNYFSHSEKVVCLALKKENKTHLPGRKRDIKCCWLLEVQLKATSILWQVKHQCSRGAVSKLPSPLCCKGWQPAELQSWHSSGVKVKSQLQMTKVGHNSQPFVVYCFSVRNPMG